MCVYIFSVCVFALNDRPLNTFFLSTFKEFIEIIQRTNIGSSVRFKHSLCFLLLLFNHFVSVPLRSVPSFSFEIMAIDLKFIIDFEEEEKEEKKQQQQKTSYRGGRRK